MSRARPAPWGAPSAAAPSDALCLISEGLKGCFCAGGCMGQGQEEENFPLEATVHASKGEGLQHLR